MRNWRAHARALMSVAALSGAATIVNAADPAGAARPRPTIYATIGTDLRAAPQFEGANRLTFLPFPMIQFSLGPPVRRFSGTRDSISVSVFDNKFVRLGPAVGFRFLRRERDFSALRGLGSVSFAAEPGAFLDVFPLDFLRLRAEVRRGFGGHQAWLADFSADAFLEIVPGWTLSGGPRLSLAGAEFNRAYFGINGVQAANSGLPFFRPGGGVKSWGAGGALAWQVNPALTATGYFEYERLVDEVADSPLVRLRGSPDQFTFGLRLSYSFDLGMQPPF